MAWLMVPFAQLGIGNGITKFFPLLKENKYNFFSFSLFLGLLGFGLLLLVFMVFKQQIIASFATNAPEVNKFLPVALLITGFSVINTLLDAFSRSFLKIAIPSFIRDVLLRLLVALLVLGYYLDFYPFPHMIWGMILVYFLAMLSMVGYMVRIGIFHLRFDWGSITWPFKKDFLRYSLITLLGTAGAILIMKIDSLMVSSMIGLDANAVYTIGFSIAVVIEMPRRAISQVAMPIISENFAANKLQEIDRIYKKIAVHQLFICLFIFLLIWVNIDSLYHFVPNKEIYQAGKWVVLLIGLGKISDVMFSVNGEIIVFSRFYVFNITATLLMCAAVILLNLLFIPFFGIEGAALASFIAMFFYNFIKFLYVKVRLDFNPFSIAVFKILFLGLLTWSISFFFVPKMEIVILDVIVRSSVVSLVYLAAGYYWKISPEGVEWLENQYQRVMTKK